VTGGRPVHDASHAELSERDLGRCAELAAELADAAIGELAGRRVADTERATKADPGDWVTTFDIGVERRARERIATVFPRHAIVGEELGTTGDPSAAPAWYIDPIDGTTNFVHALPWSSFSLAVADGGGLAVGVVADLSRGVVFSARRGAGARCDGATVRCSAATGLAGGLVLTELVGDAPWPGLGGLISRLGARHCATRIMGSSALALAWLASGSADAALLGAFHPVDIAAGLLIAREAGADVLVPVSADPVLAAGTAGGGPAPAKPDLLVAAAPGVRAELAALLAA
jgi:myo-inositol-1(or 4)-monophosphatase